MLLIRRTKTITVHDLEDGTFLIHAHLEDPHHLMGIQLVIGSATGRVVSAYATMGKVPYGDLCRQAVPLVEKLVGLRVGRGCSREVHLVVGGSEGCAHLAELVVDALRGYIPGIGEKKMVELRKAHAAMGLSEAETERRAMEELRSIGTELLPNSCVVYRKGKQGR